MSKFRKKPVVIEAEQYLPGALVRSAWLFNAMRDGLVYQSNGLTIKTLEGEMTASAGDWIIKGVKGEIYPCKPDIFAATYEAVE
jgi:hypothetical protein